MTMSNQYENMCTADIVAEALLRLEFPVYLINNL
jgi:hypothetical protein